MKVRFKRGWWRTHATLTPGNVYRPAVISRAEFEQMWDQCQNDDDVVY